MVASEVVVASVVKPVGRRVVPGRSVPEGVDPSSEGSLLLWLQSHEGKIGENSVAYAAKIEGGGFTDLYSIGFEVQDLVDVGIPKGHAITLVQNAQHVSWTLLPRT